MKQKYSLSKYPLSLFGLSGLVTTLLAPAAFAETVQPKAAGAAPEPVAPQDLITTTPAAAPTVEEQDPASLFMAVIAPVTTPTPVFVSAPAPAVAPVAAPMQRLANSPSPAPAPIANNAAALAPTGLGSQPITPELEPGVPAVAPQVARVTEDEKKATYLPPTQLFNLETANQLPRGGAVLSAGFRWYPSGAALGTGLQVFNGYFQMGVTDRLQLGVAGWFFDDDLERPVNGFGSGPAGPLLQTGAVGPQFKYQVLNGDKLRLSVAGSIELLRVFSQPGIFNNNAGKQGTTFVGGAIQVPISYSITSNLQFHFTPGVSFLPNTIQGDDYYGTFFNLGGGVSWQPIKYLAFFGDLNYAVGPGGNAVRSSNAEIFNRPVWSAGLRLYAPRIFGIIPNVDLYATNAMGNTLATRSISMVPDSNQVAAGLNVNFRF